MTVRFEHESVLRDAVVELVRPADPELIVDCTVGGGGHAVALLEVCPRAELVGLDRDPAALEAAAARLARFSDRVTLVHARFAEVATVLERLGRGRADAVLVDLGVSSHQLDTAARGFSFRADAPLDMRMDPSTGETAAQAIARLSEQELADVLKRLGEERYARRVARAIKEAAPTTTLQLAEAVRRAVPPSSERIHPATRAFQALRILVNRELEELDAWLASLPEILADGGVALAISFHSLEDRAVKVFFREHAREAQGSRFLPPPPDAPAPIFDELTTKGLVADEAEVQRNPRARSARLRAVRRRPRSDA